MPAPSEEIIFLNICWRTLISFTLSNLLFFISILYLRFWSRDTLVYIPCVPRPKMCRSACGRPRGWRWLQNIPPAREKKKNSGEFFERSLNQCLTKPRSKSFSVCPTFWSKHHLSWTISLKHIVSACSQTLYLLFKVRRARVIKEIKTLADYRKERKEK